MSGSAAQLTAWNLATLRRLSSWIIRATTSLPEPVGPRISTEMSDLAAVRIHSKTIEHLLVAADHLAEALDRRRLVFGADRGAALEEVIEQLGHRLVGRPLARMYRGGLPATTCATPKSTSSRTQFSTSSRSRPNVCISDSTSKLSSGRALR